MMEHNRCKRCGGDIHTIDSVKETTYITKLKVKRTTYTKTQFGIGYLYIKGHGSEADIFSNNEDYNMCEDCWSDFIGRFMQNRDIITDKKVEVKL